MFERLLRHFQSPPRNPKPLPEMDARHALGTLLVRVAMADKAYLFEEVEQIDRILAKAYGLKPLDAAKMRADCEKLAFALNGDEDLATVIRNTVAYEHRLEKVEALWQVVLADGVTDDREAALMDLIENQMGIERDHSEQARAAASIP
ncbi:TerB family tellurite resistance protein [Mesobacterium sp. TK19101]|uniref:TerB family tellurite resistance protein n=1 Tax=Mesobacterium hydrothermale TaxID=3111907 RepID=A0ABU6HC32_9RHOB|nr:TerB family tellurite resistance protein [Mesobacterium sp. TK19101]MEC3860014.1 TerB family tellurite resistance protein [Mesobacterium sp. TK19101]